MSEYTVEKDSHEVPCDHPLCERLHKNLPAYHEVTRRYWIVLCDGVRDDSFEVFDRKSDAVEAIKSRTRSIAVAMAVGLPGGQTRAEATGRSLAEAFERLMTEPLVLAHGPTSRRERLIVLTRLANRGATAYGRALFTTGVQQ